jgi:GNAT superfamily N-acetyltransferase
MLRNFGWFGHLSNEPAPATEKRVTDHMARCMSDDSHSMYVAEDEAGRFLGYTAVHWLPYLMLSGPEGYVSELMVAEAARGQGCGTGLLDVVREEGITRGCSRLMLANRTTRESYQRGFYTKRGWTERGDIANFVLPLR